MAIFLWGGALWLFAHPYWGIWHDARVYTLMAVRWLDPDAYARDPWFMFGSQDSFSVFSPLYGGLIALLGVDAAAWWGTLLAGFVFVWSSWLFSGIVGMLGRRWLLFLLLLSTQMVYCVNDYDFLDNFRVSESFITSRHFSVSFALLGISTVIAKRFSWGIVCFVLALIVHPLMGMWGVLVAMLASLMAYSKRNFAIHDRDILSLKKRAFRDKAAIVLRTVSSLISRHLSLIAISAGGGIAALSIAEFGPFSHLSKTWADYVENSGRIVFVSEKTHRLLPAVTCYVYLAIASKWGSYSIRPWYRAVLMVSSAAYAVNWFCSVYSPAILVMQTQLWRANWLAVVFTVVAVVDLTFRGLRGRFFRQELTKFYWALGLTGTWLGIVLIALFSSISRHQLFSLARWLGHRSFVLRHGTTAILIVSLTAWITTGAMDLLFVADAIPASSGWNASLLLRVAKSIGYTGLFGLLALLVWLTFTRMPAGGRITAGVIMLSLGLYVWDDRTSAGRELDQTLWGRHAVRRALFSEQVVPGSTVYWQRHPEHVWFSLRTASYASSTQAIGIVFSESMTLEISRRLRRVALADIAQEVPQDVMEVSHPMLIKHLERQGRLLKNEYDLHGYEAGDMTLAGLRFLCRDAELDYVVSQLFVPGLIVSSETLAGERKANQYYLYRCSDVRFDRLV